MELKVFWLQLAEDKLNDIYIYYRFKAGKRVAKRIVNGIVDKTIGLGMQSEIGQVEISLFHRDMEYRYLVYDNYKIVYWVNRIANRIEIANVFDSRQNPTKIFETK
ncbi:type II toxin-antitoxin system RelE/ParE family toxin [Nonlabens antarcticus]|uniref:type II toxin-antitoxin system RelE/ParE family toxin n=1 Tax=Nonlabens antarcticus TaxID=392714 RepID=UPI001890F96A|nr:type II toxin-antitoxin system RelE/ParE family toxin [Nonlabens antarcticus]